jgi:hypothetical protein
MIIEIAMTAAGSSVFTVGLIRVGSWRRERRAYAEFRKQHLLGPPVRSKEDIFVDKFRQKGFTVLLKPSAPTRQMIGWLMCMDSPRGNWTCDFNHGTTPELWEAVVKADPEGATAGVVAWKKVGYVCLTCGGIETNDTCEKEGFFGKRLVHRSNVFDLLDGMANGPPYRGDVGALVEKTA